MYVRERPKESAVFSRFTTRKSLQVESRKNMLAYFYDRGEAADAEGVKSRLA